MAVADCDSASGRPAAARRSPSRAALGPALASVTPEVARKARRDNDMGELLCLSVVPRAARHKRRRRADRWRLERAAAADNRGLEIDGGQPEVAARFDGLLVGGDAGARFGQQ